MNKIKTNLVKECSIATLFVVLIFFCVFAIIEKTFVKADEVTEESVLTTLFNSTNTFNVKSINLHSSSNDYNAKQNNIEYNLPNEDNGYSIVHNSNQVMDYAQITVLMHGYGAEAATWSNNYNGSDFEFSTNPSSLIYKFWQKYGNQLQIVKAEISNYTLSGFSLPSNEVKHLDYQIKDLTSQTNTAFSFVDPENWTQVYNMDTASEFINYNSNKHLLVVFDSSYTYNNKGSWETRRDASNDNVYFQFNYVLSQIALQYKSINPGNKLPKFNLIGHSRGGLTNLQYALDHPDMVENLISIGTPYNGSTTATVFGEIIENGMSDALADIIKKF